MIDTPAIGRQYKLYIGCLWLIVQVTFVNGKEVWFRTLQNKEESFAGIGYFCQNAVDLGGEKD